MRTLKVFLNIRAKQFLRLLDELGILRVILLLPLVVLVISRLLVIAFKEDKEWMAVLVTCLAMLAIHFQRSDKGFLTIAGVNHLSLFRGEYFLLSLPVLILCIISGEWKMILILLLFIFLLPLIKINFGKSIIAKPGFDFSFIPGYFFEWKSGLRKYAVSMLIIFALSMALSKFPFAVPLGILILSFIVSSFYLESEPREFIEATKKSSSHFLFYKVGKALKPFFVLALPLVLAFMIFSASYWYVPVFILIVSTATISFSIIFKYALYNPGENLENNMTFIFIFAIGFLIPFMIPLSLLFAVRYYRKAISNLDNYVYA